MNHYKLILTSGQGDMILDEKQLANFEEVLPSKDYYTVPYDIGDMTTKEINRHNLAFSTLVGLIDALHGNTYQAFPLEDNNEGDEDLISLLLGQEK